MKNIIVEVYQNTDENMENTKKMVLKNTWNDHDQNVKQLLAFLWRKQVMKSSRLKVKHSYSYDDIQTISIIETYENYDGSITTTEYRFLNVPTSLGFLDIYNI